MWKLFQDVLNFLLTIEGNNDMDNELLVSWTKALRSGDYQQGYKTLRNMDFDDNEKPYYCCMGVLANIMLKQTHNEYWGSLLSDEDSLNQYGLDLVKLSDSHQDFLMNKNDEGDSFENIANWIDEHTKEITTDYWKEQ
jgi:hypothetical protein